MTQAAPAQTKIPTDSPQPSRKGPALAATRPKKASSPARARVLAGSTGRAATRGGGEVIELECGITVYPARSAGGRWVRPGEYASQASPGGAPVLNLLSGRPSLPGIPASGFAEPGLRKTGI